MVRALLRVALVLLILATAVAFFLGYKAANGDVETPLSARVPAIDTNKARQAGAAIGEKVATGAVQANQALDETSLTAKIKAKMALDDTVRALAINVDTHGSIVTLTGTVHSEAERIKAVQLARETEGVTTVNDRLVIR